MTLELIKRLEAVERALFAPSASKARTRISGSPAVPASLPPSGAAGGDLTGNYPNPTIANAAVTAAKLGAVTDGATLDAGGAGATLEVKALGIGAAQLAAAAVTAAKLGAVTDGATLDAGGAGGTLEIKALGVGTAQLANVGPGATGPIGSSTVVPIVTIDAKGRVTALGNAVIALLTTLRNRMNAAQLAGSTLFANPFGVDVPNAVEANVSYAAAVAGSITGIVVRIGTNTSAAATTITFRVAGANTALTVVVGAGATGSFTLAGGPIAFAAGNLLSISFVNAGAGSVTLLSLEVTA